MEAALAAALVLNDTVDIHVQRIEGGFHVAVTTETGTHTANHTWLSEAIRLALSHA